MLGELAASAVVSEAKPEQARSREQVCLVREREEPAVHVWQPAGAPLGWVSQRAQRKPLMGTPLGEQQGLVQSLLQEAESVPRRTNSTLREGGLQGKHAGLSVEHSAQAPCPSRSPGPWREQSGGSSVSPGS